MPRSAPDHPAAVAAEPLMRMALRLAAEAAEADEVPVGAVIVRGEQVVATARNRMRASGPLAHAELLAIEDAIRRDGGNRLEDCTLVVTLEPCAMCAGAIVLARLRRVVFGAWDEKAGMAGSVGDLLRHPRLNHVPEVVAGVLADESAALLREFFSRRRGGA